MGDGVDWCPDSVAVWVKCEMCDEWWCTFHGQHAHDCVCPGIETFIELGVDPYNTPSSHPKVRMVMVREGSADA